MAATQLLLVSSAHFSSLIFAGCEFDSRYSNAHMLISWLSLLRFVFISKSPISSYVAPFHCIISDHSSIYHFSFYAIFVQSSRVYYCMYLVNALNNKFAEKHNILYYLVTTFCTAILLI